MTSNIRAASIFSLSRLTKITLMLCLLSAAILIYLAVQYNRLVHLKLANSNELVQRYEATGNQFWLAGIIIFFTSWLWVGFVAIKTKQLFWLWIPFLFVIVIAITNSYQNEALFHFKKANGLWKGGFSLSYFFAAGIILIAGFFILINYVLFKRYLQPTRTQL